MSGLSEIEIEAVRRVLSEMLLLLERRHQTRAAAAVRKSLASPSPAEEIARAIYWAKEGTFDSVDFVRVRRPPARVFDDTERYWELVVELRFILGELGIHPPDLENVASLMERWLRSGVARHFREKYGR